MPTITEGITKIGKRNKAILLFHFELKIISF